MTVLQKMQLKLFGAYIVNGFKIVGNYETESDIHINHIFDAGIFILSTEESIEIIDNRDEAINKFLSYENKFVILKQRPNELQKQSKHIITKIKNQ
jgi:hypothetical protein